MLGSVKQYGCTLEYVKDQSHELCLKTVKQYGCTLEYVKDQSCEI
jgi:hypothetical protein